jgi:hypothetical protein
MGLLTTLTNLNMGKLLFHSCIFLLLQCLFLIVWFLVPSSSAKNELDGPLPSEIGKLTNLQTLNLSTFLSPHLILSRLVTSSHSCLVFLQLIPIYRAPFQLN